MAKRPDYRLSAKRKDSEYKGEVGAGWKNPDGSISIRLNACVVLSAAEGLLLTLFVNDRAEPARSAPESSDTDLPF